MSLQTDNDFSKLSLENDHDNLNIDPELRKTIDKTIYGGADGSFNNHVKTPLADLIILKGNIEAELLRFEELLKSNFEAKSQSNPQATTSIANTTLNNYDNAIFPSKTNDYMNAPLINRDGYPRDDVDIFTIRLLRQNCNMLKNDLTHLIDYIHVEMGKYWEGVDKKKGTSNSTITNNNDNATFDPIQASPFCKITGVLKGSPSDQCGLQDNDLLCRIGAIDTLKYYSSHDKLLGVSNYVKEHIDREIPVMIKRKQNGAFINLELTLIPNSNNWDGPGILGCTLVKI
ncbi:uncharacterized protein SCODWIG_03515 [Saccharomycodes ludwigii]|uniref:Nas2 N-terminal domain-containing protein n=1 Tax=Saccharomycodes ludwigii TaxID=36035 RepID=A0A376BB12_9ASCO|nr:uncharacterized protein SCODWIG_03515 [Saccharomycodes ludwigii]